MTQLIYCQTLDFEVGPINKFKFKALIIKTIFPISTSINFPYITQLKYCQTLDFEADPINKFNILIIKTIFSDFKIN